MRKHKISLRRYDDMVARLVRPDVAHADTEERFQVIGLIDGQVYIAGTTWRGEQERIFPLRRASPKERRFYGEAT